MTSIIAIYRRFPTKESCIEHLETVRWKGKLIDGVFVKEAT